MTAFLVATAVLNGLSLVSMLFDKNLSRATVIAAVIHTTFLGWAGVLLAAS